MAVEDLTTAEINALVDGGTTRDPMTGFRFPIFREKPFYEWLIRTLHHLAAASAGWLAVRNDDAAAMTVRIMPGRAVIDDVLLVYAGATKDLAAFNNDIAYLYLEDLAGPTITAVADATGWPATPHIKLAEVTIASSVITAILDRRSETILAAITMTVFGRSLANAADANAARAILALGSIATQAASAVAITGGSITGMPTPTQADAVATKGWVEALIQGLDWQASVFDRDLTAPPGSPTTGDRYIVAAGATGAWATHDNKIAEWDGAAWVFTTPNEGYSVRVEDENLQLVHNGTAWVGLGAGVVIDDLVSGTNYALTATTTKRGMMLQAAVDANITDSTGGTAGNGLAAMTNTDTLTDSTTGAADDTVDNVSTATTGVDGTGSNAASKVDVDARLVTINNNFKELVDQAGTQKTLNGKLTDGMAALAAEMNDLRDKLRNSGALAP